eukprot:jgi/Ulvmu1/8595/UM045_0038.1
MLLRLNWFSNTQLSLLNMFSVKSQSTWSSIRLPGGGPRPTDIQGDTAFYAWRSSLVSAEPTKAACAPDEQMLLQVCMHAGCTLSDLGGDLPPLRADAPIHIVNTTIVDNVCFADVPVIHLYTSNSAAWLRGVTLARNNAAQVILSELGGQMYSDSPLQYFSGLERQYVDSLSAPGASAFLSPQDSFFVEATAGVPKAPASVPAQAFNADAVVVVTNPQQLQQAVQNGARHIEVMAHIDLTSIEAARNPGDILLGFFSDSTYSIRGNCETTPELQLGDPPLLPLLPGQCVIMADMNLWQVRHGRLWMHNLYLRHVTSVRSDVSKLLWSTMEGGNMWLTQITVQGVGNYADGTGVRGLTSDGRTYIEGCQFSQLGGSTYVVSSSAPLHVVNTSFTNNMGADDASAVMHTNPSSGIVWLQGSTLANNSVALPLIAGQSSGGFISDVPREFFNEITGEFKDAPLLPGDSSVFLTGDEQWLKDVQAGFPSVTISSQAAVEPPTTQVTAVTTAQDLQAALASAARHIELQAHLDLRIVGAAGVYGSSSYLLGTVGSGTHTLRGNCSTAVDSEALQLEGAALRPLAEGQCLIVADQHMLLLMHGRLWIDNLYLRVQHTSRSDLPRLLSLSALGGRLWLTRSTLQGDATGAPQGANGIYTVTGNNGIYTVTGNKVLAHGVQFLDLGEGTPPVHMESIAKFASCMFSNNSVTGINSGVVLSTGPFAQVWLQSCEFVNNAATFELVAFNAGTLYSDGSEKVYQPAASAEVQPQSEPQDKSIYLTFEDDFITDAATELGLKLQLEPGTPDRPAQAPSTRDFTVVDVSPETALAPDSSAAPTDDERPTDDNRANGNSGVIDEINAPDLVQPGPSIANNVNGSTSVVNVNVPSSASNDGLLARALLKAALLTAIIGRLVC